MPETYSDPSRDIIINKMSINVVLMILMSMILMKSLAGYYYQFP